MNIGPSANQAPADLSSPSSHILSTQSHHRVSISVTDANNLGNMLACSSLAPTFDNCGVVSPSAHPMHSAERRRPPLKAPHPSDILKCPRCDSLDTKFCYYNNYSLAQPRYFCKNCKRYWTSGGTLRNVPVGGGLRKNKRSKLKLAAEADAAMAAAQVLAKEEAVAVPDTGHIEYEGKAIATTSRTPSAETMAKVENHVAKAMPSESMYAHTMPAITSSFKVGGYAGALALNYGTGGEELSGSSAIVVSSEQEHAGTVYRDNDQQAMASIYNGQLEPQLCSSYAGVSGLPNTGRHGQLRNIVGEGYMVNYKFMESGTIPVKGEQSVWCAGDHGDGNSESEGPITSKRVRMMDQQGSDDGGAGAEGSGGGSATTYDWQVLSEGIFNGGSNSGSSSFFYIPSSSWPDDFCQFSDTGPG